MDATIFKEDLNTAIVELRVRALLIKDTQPDEAARLEAAAARLDAVYTEVPGGESVTLAWKNPKAKS